jgi:polyphosphate kinase
VTSIVGRFLEHARVYYFRNQGEEEYYIGSADCMKRNLESRVETLFPVEKAEHRATLRQIIDIQLADPRSAWDMQSDGSYVQRSGGEDAIGSQEQLIALAEARHREATRLRKRKPKGIVRRRSAS